MATHPALRVRPALAWPDQRIDLPAPPSALETSFATVWHSEFGHDGHDNQHTRHPAIIAGGGNRTLRLGRYLRLRDIASEARVPHNKLLTSICHAMGRTEIDFFGDRDLVDRPEYQGPLEMLMV